MKRSTAWTSAPKRQPSSAKRLTPGEAQDLLHAADAAKFELVWLALGNELTRVYHGRRTWRHLMEAGVTRAVVGFPAPRHERNRRASAVAGPPVLRHVGWGAQIVP
jgi:hypothetical protein